MILKNSKHEEFAYEIATGTPASQAYLNAGYSPNGKEQGSSRLLKNVDIQNRIEEIRNNIQKKVEANVGITKAYVIQKLEENRTRAMQEVPVLDSKGKPTGDYKYDGAVANKALELIGKELGMFQGRDAAGNPGNPATALQFFYLTQAKADDESKSDSDS